MLCHFLDAENPPIIDCDQSLRGRLGERETKQIQVIASKSQQQQAHETKDLSRGSATPLRSSYILIVEVTIKVEVSFTSLPLSRQPQRSLEVFTKKSRVIQNS
jgi:hypothetical protein